MDLADTIPADTFILNKMLIVTDYIQFVRHERHYPQAAVCTSGTLPVANAIANVSIRK